MVCRVGGLECKVDYLEHKKLAYKKKVAYSLLPGRVCWLKGMCVCVCIVRAFLRKIQIMDL